MTDQIVRHNLVSRGVVEGRQGLRSRGVPIMGSGNGVPLTTGNTYHVDSGHGSASDNNTGTDPAAPLATIDAAIGKCTASNGDLILVAPGHAETLAAASAITADVIGVTVIGMGVGNLRPTLTFATDTAASIVISAAGFSFINFIFVASIDALANPLHVQAADVTLIGTCRDTSDTVEAERFVLTTAAADRLTLDLVYEGRTGGNACVNAVRLVGVDEARINIDFYGKASTAVVELITTACTNVVVTGRMHVSGTTNGSKNVVDTQGSGTWYMDVEDTAAGARYTGGSAAAVASDDVSAITSAIGTITNTAGTATIGGVLGDFANDSLVARLNDIGSNVDATTTETIQGKIGTDTELADRSLYDILNGGGPAAAATAAAPANDVSLYGAVRAIYDRQLGDGTSSATNTRLGKKVTRAAADIFDGTAAKSLFTVSGGRILLTHFEIEVTVAAIDASASNMKFVSNPTVGTDLDIAANLDINADELGTIYSLTGIVSDAVTGGSGGGAMAMQRPIVIPEGAIAITTAADVGTGGALGKCELWYIPLDDGASVASA